jgi:hypothetical protein
MACCKPLSGDINTQTVKVFSQVSRAETRTGHLLHKPAEIQFRTVSILSSILIYLHM